MSISWEQSYRSGSLPWLRHELSPAFSVWFGPETSPSLRGKRVLVPGCGTSLEPLEFARRGAQVTCVDIAPTALAAQAKSFGKESLEANLVVSDILAWRSGQAFDIIYEQTCLCAIEVGQRAAYAATLEAELQHGGDLYALLMQTNGRGGPPFHCGLAEMKKLFPADRWLWPVEEPFRAEHPIGLHELGFVLTRNRRS